MRSRAVSPRASTLLLSILLGSQALTNASCVLVAAIDVCERRGPAEHDVNQRTEGDQFLEPQALAVIEGAGALVLFSSVDASGRTEVRGARLDADGTSLPTCEMMGEPTLPSPSAATRDLDRAAVAFPPYTGAVGVAVIRQTTTDGERLWAIAISENGCPNLFGTVPPLLVSAPGPGVSLGFFHVAPIGRDRMVVSWVEVSRPAPLEVRTRLLARVIDTRAQLLFMPTTRAPDGAAATLPPDGDSPSNHALVPMDDERFALIWLESSVARHRVRAVVLDDRLDVVAGPVLLSERVGSIFDAPSSLTGAFDGTQIFAAWTLPTDDGTGRAHGAFIDSSARLLRAERAPEGGPFRLGSLESGSETDLASTVLPGGGFLVAWTERDTTGRDDPSGTGLRALGLDTDGSVLFANRSCERTDFPLALAFEGDQTRPALVSLGDGTILLLYTNVGGSSNDRSGGGLRGVGLRRSDLFAERGAETD